MKLIDYLCSTTLIYCSRVNLLSKEKENVYAYACGQQFSKKLIHTTNKCVGRIKITLEILVCLLTTIKDRKF